GFSVSFHRDHLCAVARRRDRAAGLRARCRTTRSGQPPASALLRRTSRIPPPAARSSASTRPPVLAVRLPRRVTRCGCRMRFHDWLADLRSSDQPAALRVAKALATLMREGASLGDPVVLSTADSWPWALTEALDRSYQQSLDQLTALRRGEA